MNIVWFYICVSLYFLACVLHLVICFKEDEKWRRITKGLCMGFLGVAFIFYAPNKPIIYASIFLGLLGDLLLLKKKNQFYLGLGAWSFACMHGLNIYLITNALSYAIPWYVFALALFFLVLLIAYGKLTKKNVHPIVRKGALGYFYLLLFSAVMAGMLMVDNFQTSTLLIFLGYVVFLISDSTLVTFNYIHSVKRKDFYVMLTYLTAQTLIYFGLLLL